MPIKCRLIDDPTRTHKSGTPLDIKPGDMWYWSEDRWEKVKRDWANPDTYIARFLSIRYVKQDMVDRPPLVLVLPSGETWNMDFRPSNGDPEGWQLEGTAPNITARPSIQSAKYHGFLSQGYLSDDIDGKIYES